MRRWMIGCGAALVAVLGLAADRAAAAPQTVNVMAMLRVHVGIPAGGTNVVASTSPVSGSISVDEMAGTLQVPAGLLSVQSLVVPITATTAPVSQVTITAQNATGTFSFGGGAAGACPGPLNGGTAGACIQGAGFGGAMALIGTVHVPSPLTTSVPLSVIGTGGTTGGAILQIQGAPWTTRTAAVTTTQGGAWLTLMGEGLMAPQVPMNLVTPAHIRLDGQPFGVFLEIQLVPEPRPALLILAGLTATAGWRRLRPR